MSIIHPILVNGIDFSNNKRKGEKIIKKKKNHKKNIMNRGINNIPSIVNTISI